MENNFKLCLLESKFFCYGFICFHTAFHFLKAQQWLKGIVQGREMDPRSQLTTYCSILYASYASLNDISATFWTSGQAVKCKGN